MRYRLRTLGRLSLHPDEPDAPAVMSDSKSLAVLAYTAAVPGREARRSHLAALLWPRSDRKRARSSLRQALYYLSQRAEDGLTLSDDGVVAANPRKLSVDLWEFDEALEEEAWERAVELYDGPFLDGYRLEGAREFEGWSEAQNERVWSGLKAAYYRLVESASEAGEYQKAVRYGREYAELNPLDETAQRTLIRARLAAGDRVGAYRAYERYRSLLRSELDTEPDDELRRRVEELRSDLFETPVPRRPAGEDGADEDAASPAATPAVGDRGSEGGPDASTPATPPEPRSPGESGRGAPARSGRAVPTWAGTAAAALLGAVLGAAVVGLPGSPVPDGSLSGASQWEGAEGTLLAETAADGQRELTIEDGRIRVRPREHRPGSLLSPDGRRWAEPIHTAGGADVGVIDRESGDTLRVLAHGEADEQPLAWGPRGRHLLYWTGERVEDDRAFVRHLRIADLETGRTTPVDRAPDLGDPRQATWSPLGPWIAFRGEDAAGEADIYLAHADGGGLRRVTPDEGEARDPAWSPGGDRLAYVSREGGDGDLHVVGLDGESDEAVTHGGTDDRHPVWLSPRHIAFLSDRDGGTDVWVIDLQTRGLTKLTDDGDYRRLRPLEVPGRTAPLERVRIAPRPDTVAPGERLDMAAAAWTAGGERVAAELVPLAWRAVDRSRVRTASGGGLRVEGVGPVGLVADAGGWAADTLWLDARPLVPRPAPVAVREDWSDGIDSSRWSILGSPEPYVAGGGTPAFVSNGDANYDSGAVSRGTVRLDGARTVELRAALPFTGRHYEALKAGLVRSAPEPGDPTWSASADGGLMLEVVGTPDGPRARVKTGAEGWRVPVPAEPERWHRYALQVEADGRVSYLVDGRRLWRSPGPAVEDLLGERLHVTVGGRSLRPELKVADVTVYRGLRYVFDRQPTLVREDEGEPRPPPSSGRDDAGEERRPGLGSAFRP